LEVSTGSINVDKVTSAACISYGHRGRGRGKRAVT
jgi:hypothetical protein